MEDQQVIQADFTWTRGVWERDVQVVVGTEGRIEHVGALDIKPTHRLRGRALLPGFVNAHSHAFQRGLRGRAETFPEQPGSFWSWRDEMYALVESLDADRFYTLSRAAFEEMLRCGITAVGEFHYLHHDRSGAGNAFDEAVLRAANDAGIRLVLLSAYYQTGGFERAAVGPQRRFVTPDPPAFWRQIDALARRITPRTQVLGAAVHSVRAAPMDQIVEIHQECRKRGLVFHMHLEEQPGEIEECIAACGNRPLALVNERLNVDDAFTAVHCTHSNPVDIQKFVASGGRVCLCPLTEANLGDGIADVPAMSGGNICLGTDSNVRIDMIEEMRWLEHVQRAYRRQRGICRDESGRVAEALLTMATENGARALGLKAGRIEPGCLADFAVVDLAAPSLSGVAPERLPAALLFGAGREAIAAACVAGRWTKPPESAHN